MDLKDGVRSELAWADSYKNAESYEEDCCGEDDEIVQDLIASHNLWMAMLKSWADCHPRLDIPYTP